jgi:CO/xanthine dehydrogenase Mo-binding subunit
MTQELKCVGKSVPLRRVGELATGKAQFVDDMPADLQVKVLGSPHPHAMIKSIDTSEAEKLEGVEAVLTYKDVPQRLMPRACARALYILDPHLRHVGDEVAAVAATSKAIAEKALDLIKVEYEVLPAVFDPEEAIKPDAPKLYPEGNVYGTNLECLVEQGKNEPTLISYGDVEKGFAEADVIVEDKFEVNPQVHAALEPYVCIAEWRGDELTLWNPNQVPYEVRDGVSYALGMPESKVRVISDFVGGGFGGKYLARYQAITALLSKKTHGKRTKYLLTREEALTHCRRYFMRGFVKMGAKKDGTLTAIYVKSYADLGAYGNFFGNSAFWGAMPLCQYNAANQKFEGWDVHTNHFTAQPYRTVQVPGMTFCTEQVIDEVAEKLNMDPITFRLKNMAETGDESPYKPWVDNTPGYPRGKLINYPSKKILREVMEKIEWKKKWKGYGKPIAIEGPKIRSLGLVYGGYDGGLTHSGFMSMALAMNKDGSVNIMAGTQNMGQGVDTTLCQIVAEFLDIPFEDVNILAHDTNIGQYDLFGARASRELTTGGRLLLRAAEKIKQQVREIASNLLEVRPEEIEIGGKKAYVKEYPERSVPFSKILTTSITASDQGLMGEVFPPVLEGIKAANCMIQAAEVEVDIETGEVKVLKVVTGNCPGRMINPTIVKGQYTGGAVQALGMALQEEFKYDEKNSVYLHSSYVDYRVPRAMDAPMVENVIIEEPIDLPPDQGIPYGAQGVGELGHWGGPAIMASALYNAIGVRLKSSPMTGERILAAIQQKEGRK